MIDEFVKILVERLEEQRGHICHYMPCNGCKYIGDCNDRDHAEDVALDKAIEIVNQLAEESNNGWISCSERLPKKDEYVLCSLNENNPTIIHTVIIARYDGADCWHNGIVLAWQPLPAPFKPKEVRE